MVWNDAPTLAKRLKEANEQFDEGLANVLVVVPEFNISVSEDRYQLVQAFIGEFAITFPANARTGSAVNEGRTVFQPKGEFLRSRNSPPNARHDGEQPDRRPAFTRVSAVVSVEERLENPATRRTRFTPEQLAEASARRDDRFVFQAVAEALVASLGKRPNVDRT